MNLVKKKLLEEIDKKIAKRRQIKNEISQREQLEHFMLEFVKEVEDLTSSGMVGENLLYMIDLSIEKLEHQVKSIDQECSVSVSWDTDVSIYATYEEHVIKPEDLPKINGVLIRWSRWHQLKYNVEPELFIDVASLILLGQLDKN